MTEPSETDAVLAGADVERTSSDQAEPKDAGVLDEQAWPQCASRFRSGTCSPSS